MTSITKRFEFCYGHRLPDYDGKCNQQHGHNSVVEVEVVGRDPDAYPTMVMDFGKLKEVAGQAIDNLDHQDLTGRFCEPTYPHAYLPPTAETICRHLVNVIRRDLPDGVELLRLRVTETPNSWAEWKGRV